MAFSPAPPEATDLLLDTNVLLLLLTGQVDPGLFFTFKRVNQFDFDDLRLLLDLILRFRRLVTTAQVLAETSNFLDNAPHYKRSALMNALKTFVQEHQELIFAAAEITNQPEFEQLGLTDTGLLLASADVAVVTVDGELYGRISNSGRHGIYFSALRSNLDA